MIGSFIILTGVVWVSLAKGKIIQSTDQSITESEALIYRLLSVLAALFAGFLNCMRTFQAKFIQRKTGYTPLDFSVDAGLLTGLCLFLLAAYFYFLSNDPTYTLYNLGVATASSSLLMFTSFIALNAMVKGLAGPTSAIINTNAIVQIVMNAVILGMVPTYSQVAGSLIAISGVAVMMLWK